MSSPKSFSSQVVKSFLYSGVGSTVGKLINVVALFVVLKLITPEAFGIASIVLAIFAVVQAVTELGLGVAIVQAKSLSRRQIDSLFWLSLALTAVLYAVIYFGAPLASNFYDQPLLTPLIQVHGLIIIIFTFYLVPRNILKKELQFKEIAIIDNLALFSSSAVMLLLAYLKYGAWAIILGEVGNRFAQLIIAQFFYPYWPKFQFNYNEIKEKVRFGLYATGSRLLYNLYSNADYLIVGRVFGAEAVGIYTLAFRIVSDTVKTLTSNLNEVAYPAFSKLQTELDRLRKYFFTIARGSLLLFSSILIVIAVYIENLLLLGGYDEWMDAVPLIHIFTAIAVLRTISTLVPQLLNALGEAKLNFYYSLSNAFVMPAAFIIGAQYGLIGVGWSWVIAFPVVISVLFYFGSKELKLSFFSFINQIFSGFWILPLFLAFCLGFQVFLIKNLNENSILIPVIGIFISIAIAGFIFYKREKEVFDLFRGKKK
ncbi:MAG: lipopolysaccharide biosynthesis protein [Balneolaceae bacterium]